MPDNSRERAHVLAAIHGSAAWFAEHPQELAPDYVEHRRVISHAEEIDPHTRKAAVVAFAERHAVPLQTSGSIVWAELDLAAPESHGVRVRYVVATNTHQPEGWR